MRMQYGWEHMMLQVQKGERHQGAIQLRAKPLAASSAQKVRARQCIHTATTIATVVGRRRAASVPARAPCS